MTDLTEEQKGTFPHYIKRWTEIGLSTEPINREKHDAAVRAVYALAKLDAPVMIYVPDPMSGAITASVYQAYCEDEVKFEALIDLMDKTVAKAVSPAHFKAVREAVSDAVWVAVAVADGRLSGKIGRPISSKNTRLKWVPWLYGNQWAGYAAWAEFFLEQRNVPVNRDCLNMMEQGHYIWPFKKVCFASEKPIEIKTDPEGRSHCETGPSVVYPSGWGPTCWHGDVFPPEWIEHPPTPAEALKLENIEQRRVACSMIGWAEIIKQLPTRILDEHPDPEVGTLVDVEFPDTGADRFLIVKELASDRTFAIPSHGATTAQEAQAQYHGETEFVQPVIRT